ncbi:hypothetical protein [Variovorax atrisoli]|uniref:hypothetical protein n=1 Tax=Variovorax atrisoli TaxID=3394203 RepID=UPI00339282B9
MKHKLGRGCVTRAPAIVMAVSLGGCISAVPYVPSDDGPSAMLVVPSKITSWRPGSVGSKTLSFSVADDQGCGRFFKSELATPESGEVIYKIPANKEILVNYAYGAGIMSCNVTASFRAVTTDAKYVLEGQVRGLQCLLTVSEKTGDMSLPVILEPAYSDAWSGRKACKRRQDL